jgi:hypothetical protein
MRAQKKYEANNREKVREANTKVQARKWIREFATKEELLTMLTFYKQENPNFEGRRES